MSSASVYGFSENVMSEISGTNPLTQYSISKVENENFILDNEFSFQSIILRNSTAFGFSKNLRLDLVVNDLTYSGFFEKKIDLLSDGTPKRPLVHIGDICNFINSVIKDDRNLDKEIFNVGSEAMNFSIKQIAETVGNVLGLDNITFGAHDSDQRSYELNFDKIFEYFPKYQISYTLEKGINDLVSNFKNYSTSGNERRIKAISKLILDKKVTDNLFWN